MPSLSSGSVGDVRGPDYTRMAIRAKWRKARAAKNGDAMLEALDEAESRGSTVSGSVTQDEDQAMRGIAAQEARAAAAKLYMLRKASGNGPEELKTAKNRLNAAGGESSLTVAQAPPTSAVAPGPGGGTGAKGAGGPAGGALTKAAQGMFPGSEEIGMDEEVPPGFRETGVSRGKKLIAPSLETGPDAPPPLTGTTYGGTPKRDMSDYDSVGNRIGLSEYGRKYLKERYAKGVPLEVQREMRATKAQSDAKLSEEVGGIRARFASEKGIRDTVNAAAQKRREEEMARMEAKTAKQEGQNTKTVRKLEKEQYANLRRMKNMADEEDINDAGDDSNPIRDFYRLPANTRTILGSFGKKMWNLDKNKVKRQSPVR
jgi:hypothetical protein